MQLKLPGIILVLLMALGLLAGTPASAQTTLPSSDTPTSAKWLKMNPSTFAGTIQSAKEQCDKDAALDLFDSLTPEKCVQFEGMLKSDQCGVESVPDGITLNFLNGRRDGVSSVWTNMKKQLGRNDRALLCKLGDGVSIYWFTGVKGQSCNNIGVVLEKVTLPVAEAIIVQQPKKPVCKMVTTTTQTQPTNPLFISSLYLTNCCCGALYTPALYLKGQSSGTITQSILVCS